MSSIAGATPATSLPSAGTTAMALAAALVVIAVLGVVMWRHSDAVPLLAILALPFRVPISTDGRTVNLLIPLYLVIAAGTLTQLVPRWLNRDTSKAPRRSPITLEWLLLGAVVLYALQAIYSPTRGRPRRTSRSSTFRLACCSC